MNFAGATDYFKPRSSGIKSSNKLHCWNKAFLYFAEAKM